MDEVDRAILAVLEKDGRISNADLAERVSRQLGREVNVHRIAPESWAASTTDPFITSVRERPLTQLNLDQEA
ncbi:AsnC family transcriptional regulator [Kibdelosporangium lantanae]|uniref:AsnC family transcriptional regulator n=1 Tax=Kibdelosporangium lantanae TaxID=1497396 RepID=A0ABW3M8I8_9PSEU